MTIVLQFIIFVMGILGVTVLSSTTELQKNARDVERKNDIGSIRLKLEEHYVNANGQYPTEKELLEEYDTELPGLDQDSLVDPDGRFIQSGDYTYSPIDCTAVGCRHYRLSTRLENEDDPYIVTSLN